MPTFRCHTKHVSCRRRESRYIKKFPENPLGGGWRSGQLRRRSGVSDVDVSPGHICPLNMWRIFANSSVEKSEIRFSSPFTVVHLSISYPKGLFAAGSAHLESRTSASHRLAAPSTTNRNARVLFPKLGLALTSLKAHARGTGAWVWGNFRGESMVVLGIPCSGGALFQSLRALEVK